MIAHHVGHGHVNSQEWLETALSGNEVTITRNAIDVENAERTATYHEVEREETIQLLVDNGDRLCARIGGAQRRRPRQRNRYIAAPAAR